MKKLGDLIDLYSLHLENNQLKMFPIGITKLNSLAFLGLSKNQSTDIPPKIKYLEQIRKLFLGNNQFKQFPIELINLQNLTFLIYSKTYWKHCLLQ